MSEMTTVPGPLDCILASIERNERAIEEQLRGCKPNTSSAWISMCGGWRRNIARAKADSNQLRAALRECVAAMAHVHAIIDDIPSQVWPAIDGAPEVLSQAIAKAREALGE